MRALVLGGFLTLAFGCAGGGPEPATVSPAEPATLPEGFTAGESVGDDVSVACAADGCGLWSARDGWLVEPAAKAKLEASGGVVRIREASTHRYYSVSKRAFLPGGPWVDGGLFQEDRLWVQRELGADERVTAGSERVWVLLDAQGAVVKEFPASELADPDDFSGGLAAAYAPKADEPGELGLGGYVAPDGSWAIPPKYEEVADFRDGAAEVVTTDGRKVTIDAQAREK